MNRLAHNDQSLQKHDSTGKTLSVNIHRFFGSDDVHQAKVSKVSYRVGG